MDFLPNKPLTASDRHLPAEGIERHVAELLGRRQCPYVLAFEAVRGGQHRQRRKRMGRIDLTFRRARFNPGSLGQAGAVEEMRARNRIPSLKHRGSVGGDP